MFDSTQLATKYKSDWDRDGYAVIPGFLDADEVAEVQAHIDGLLNQTPSPLPPEHRFLEDIDRPESVKYLARLSDYDPFFEELQKSNRFIHLAEGLLGDGAVHQGVEWFNKCARIGKYTPPHQDGYYYKIEPNEGIHFWLALDPVDEGNGCVRYIPGSHQRGLRPHVQGTLIGFSQSVADYSDDDEAQMRSTTLAPGDLLVHHTLAIHRADPNTSNRERRALGIVYYAAQAKVDIEKVKAYRNNVFKQWQKSGKM